jgi:hypothetical protein
VLPAPSAAYWEAWATEVMFRAISALPRAASAPLWPISRVVADCCSTALAMVLW